MKGEMMTAKRALHGVLSFGFSELIPFVKRSRFAKLLIVLLVLNEVRGLAVFIAGIPIVIHNLNKVF
jgi:hypothetical protein